MKQSDEPTSLERLQEDIRRFHSKNAPKSSAQPQGSGGGVRMVADIASGVLVGAGLGILLDRWLGTSPVFCILLLLFGAGVGFRNLWRASLEMEKESPTDDVNKNEP